MRHNEQIRVLQGLMNHLDNDSNVDVGCQLKNPATAYTDPKRAKLEWRKFFQTYPQVLGLSADLPEPGSFFTNNDLGKPILCTRDKAGAFRAFLNVCTHRGTMLESEPRGKKSVFSCPFHAWAFSTSGDLVAVPKESHFGKVDKDCHSLIPLPAVEKFGLLWVSPDKNASIDMNDLLGPELSDELDSWDLTEATFHDSTAYPHACNWKLAVDTYGETYHFSTLHRDTLFPRFYGNCQMYDTYKRNHRMALCIRPIDKMRGEPQDQWHVLRGTVPVYYLFPNIQLIMNSGGVTLVRIYPAADDPNNSRSEISFYTFPEERRLKLGPIFEENYSVATQMESFASIIQAEDYVAAAKGHVGVLSGALDHVVFGRNEPALHHYHNTFNEALGLPPLEKVSA